MSKSSTSYLLAVEFYYYRKGESIIKIAGCDAAKVQGARS